VGNAIKFRDAERNPEIRISCFERDDFLIFKVWDNGFGINLDAHGEKLFKLYKRFNLHTEGKGIGLYLVKLQTELLGGTVEVASEVNAFTEFTISLPFVARLPEPIQQV
jgi:signal transduction histidine kinase